MIKIGLDSSRPNLGWHINDVIVEASNMNQTIFRCNNWLDFKQGDGSIERELYPSRPKRQKDVDYKVFIKTSNVKNAGTNANVFIQLFGDEYDTGKYIKSSNTGKYIIFTCSRVIIFIFNIEIITLLRRYSEFCFYFIFC